VAVWNDDLTAAEITALYNSGMPLDASSNSGNYTSSANVQGYWRFGENSGTTAYDLSGDGNHGTISGAIYSSPGADAFAPTMTITAAEGADGFTSNDATLALTFTSSEATSNFAVGDITETNGALSSFAATSSTVYTATFTPAADGSVTIDVGAAGFADDAGNDNTAATQFNWIYDTSAPTMTITAAEGADGFTSNDSTLALTFTSSEPTTNFAVGDITVTNGSLSNFAATSSTVYTATFTPAADGAVTIDVGAADFTDSYGNNNTAATQFTWTYDTSRPTITITASNGSNAVSDSSTTNDGTLTVTFTSSEPTTNFALDDITETNGSLSSFTQTSTTVYTVTFTPTADGAATINVAGSTFTDAAGNNNTAATQFNWTYDGTAPAMIGIIVDGTGADIDWTNSTSSLTATWSGFSDTLSGIQKYEYAIGTSSGGTAVVDWTNKTLTHP